MPSRRAIIGVFALVLGVACASTPKLLRQPTSPFIYSWLEWTEQGTPRLRLAVEVPLRELQAPGEPGAPDLLVVSAVLLDPQGKRVVSNSWRTDLAAVSTQSNFLRNEYVLSPKQAGRLDLQLGILLRGRVLVGDWQRPFVVPPFPPEQRQLSEPVFLAAGSGLPLPSHVYEDVEPGSVRSSIWVPAQEPAVPVDISWHVERGDVLVVRGVVVVPVRSGTSTPFTLPLPELPPGSYSLWLEVPAEEGGEVARAGGRWQVVPRIEAWADSLPATEVLEVVLPSKVYRELQRASASEQLRMWQDALQQLAPGPVTEALDLLQDRWRQASLRFAEDEVPGWRTARGRVYIRRGAPDEIDRLADPYDTNRIERWRYVRDNIVFVFRDVNGTGVFVLERTNDVHFP